jgi:hypothetical protein
MYTWPFTVLVWYMYINNNNNKRYHRNRETIVRGIDCFSVSMISFIFIIINVHVPDQYNERSCIHVLEVSIVSLFLYDRSLYWSGTCTLIIIKIKDIIETEKQSIPLTHVYMTTRIHVLEVSIVSLFLWYLLLLLLLMYMYKTSTVNDHVYMGQIYHRNRETINTSDTCIHDRSLY